MTTLLNKKKVRAFALAKAAETRLMADGQPRFTRVRPEFMIEVEAAVKTLIESKVHSLPSAGRTI